MRGYFGIGVENISKAQNVGAIVRTAHAFGASFFFAIQPAVDLQGIRQTDTSHAVQSLPFYEYKSLSEMPRPKGSQLVGIELTDQSIPLPSFRHPHNAIYILGPERGNLSPETQAACDHLIQIPMKFCVNVSVAGALVMYDRLTSMGRFAPRPVKSGGPTEDVPAHKHGGVFSRREA